MKTQDQTNKLLNHLLASSVVFLLPMALPAQGPTFSDANWISLGGIPGVDGEVSAMVMDLAGNLYVGGRFAVAGSAVASSIAKWDGTNWSALGSGVSGRVDALAVSGSNVYAGGWFTSAGGIAATNIAKWDGSAWSNLGSGINGWVRAVAVSGSDLYAGGSFTNAGGTAASSIAKWDGSTWSALGLGVGDPSYAGTVYALAVSGSDLYAGGYFTNAGGIAASNIAKWDGSAWSNLASGVAGPSHGGTVYALAVSGSDLYAGGYFTSAGGVPATNIAKWDGSSWSLGSGMEGYPGYRPPAVCALSVSDSGVYAAGGLDDPRGPSYGCIFKWDGSSWSTLSSWLQDPVEALAVLGNHLYAGGYFSIATWDGSSWSALSPVTGVNGSLDGLAVSGSNVYAAGWFTTAGGMAAASIAKWNGSNWSALGSGMTNTGGGIYRPVCALAVSGSDLYAGGYFGAAGDVAAANLTSFFCERKPLICK